MRIVEINALENGAHRNQNSRATIIPNGWAIVPDTLETPNFPFGEITVAEVDGVMTVTKWVAKEMPPVEEIPTEPTARDDTDAMLVDHELRITMLELGV